MDIKTRFWNKVDRSGGPDACWRWTAATDKKSGYGKFTVTDKKRVFAHRFAYELENGEIPAGLVLRHRCDNRRCCNPTHLLPGTHQENTADMIERGRGVMQVKPMEIPRGAKLSSAQADEIRRIFTAGEMKPGEIAKLYKVSHSIISLIIHGHRWKKLSL